MKTCRLPLLPPSLPEIKKVPQRFCCNRRCMKWSHNAASNYICCPELFHVLPYSLFSLRTNEWIQGKKKPSNTGLNCKIYSVNFDSVLKTTAWMTKTQNIPHIWWPKSFAMCSTKSDPFLLGFPHLPTPLCGCWGSLKNLITSALLPSRFQRYNTSAYCFM